MAKISSIGSLDGQPQAGCICGSHEYVVVLEGLFNRHRCVNYPFRIIRCVACGLHRTDPPPYTEESVSEVYGSFAGGEGEALAEDGAMANGAEEEFAKLAAEVLDHIRPFAGAGRLLDVGCSTGSIMLEAKRRGYEVSGVEVNPVAAEFAAQRTGSKVFAGTLEEAPFTAASFDLVVMNHVFEHVTNPRLTLAQLRQLLVPGGALFLGQPNFASLLRRVYGVNWYGLDPQLHVWQYTPRTLRELVGAASLVVESVSTRHTMAYGWEPTLKGVAQWGLAKFAGFCNSGDNVWLVARKPA